MGFRRSRRLGLEFDGQTDRFVRPAIYIDGRFEAEKKIDVAK